MLLACARTGAYAHAGAGASGARATGCTRQALELAGLGACRVALCVVHSALTPCDGIACGCTVQAYEPVAAMGAAGGESAVPAGTVRNVDAIDNRAWRLPFLLPLPVEETAAAAAAGAAEEKAGGGAQAAAAADRKPKPSQKSQQQAAAP